jgi:hypothetical protein
MAAVRPPKPRRFVRGWECLGVGEVRTGADDDDFYAGLGLRA